MRDLHRDIVGAIVRDPSGRILLGRKNSTKGGVYPDCWHAPGGGVEVGEDHRTALNRELLEEINLDARFLPCSLLDDSGSGISEKRLPSGEVVLAKMRFYMYQVDVPLEALSQISPKEEFIELRWFATSELGSIKLTPPGIELFRRLGYLGL